MKITLTFQAKKDKKKEIFFKILTNIKGGNI